MNLEKLLFKLSGLQRIEGPGITQNGASCSCGQQFPGKWNVIQEEVIQHLEVHKRKKTRNVKLRVLEVHNG